MDKKIHENKIRDKENISQLEKNGWQVLLVYGCELKKQKKDATLNNLLNKIKESLNSEKNEETHTQ